MSGKIAFRLAVIAAVAMLAIAAFMGVTAPPCHPLPMSTLTAFELVRSVADLQRIFGMPGDACRADLVNQLDHANTIDMFAYIPAYTAFYALTAHALGRRDRTLGWIAVALAIGCAVADVFENLAMFHFSAAPDQDFAVDDRADRFDECKMGRAGGGDDAVWRDAGAAGRIRVAGVAGVPGAAA